MILRKPTFMSGEEAAAMIQDGSTILPVGMTLVSAAETVLKAIEQRFLDTGSPKELTIVHSCGQSDKDRGIQHFAHEGMLTRIIGGHWGLQPKTMKLIAENKILAYCFPQGQFAQLFRSMAGGEPGKITKVGLGTFIDPRLDGGKMNERTKQEGPDLVDIVTIDGEEYMRYKPIPIDYCIIRGTYIDEQGNLATDEEAMSLELWGAVMACKKYGGKVIAQAKYLVQNGTLHCKKVTIPGVFIDAAVICPNPEEDHRQTHSFAFDPAYCGDIRRPEAAGDRLPLTLRKVIGRRALCELSENDILNVGTGIPNDVIGPILAEEAVAEDVTITVESGVYGGVPLGGVDFGIAKNNFALVRHDDQFDFYNGAGVDVTYMGAGEVDADGNVNATRLGETKPTGAGGFIDITTNAKHVVFCSSFTGGGLDCSFEDGKLHIRQEGRIIKFVKKLRQVSYNAKNAVARKQKMHYVTERAVFELTKQGLVLTEMAPGIDLQKDILDLMEFKPIISPHLKQMDPSIFSEDPFGLKKYL